MSRCASPAKPMTTANCGATDEFDFRLIFGEDGQPGPGPPLGPAGAPRGRGGSAGFLFFSERGGEGSGGCAGPAAAGGGSRGERRRPSVRPSVRPSGRGRFPAPLPFLPRGLGAIGRASPRRNNFLWEKKPKSSHRAGGAAPGAVAPAGKRPRVGCGGPTPPEPGERRGAAEGRAESSTAVTGPHQSAARALPMKSFNRSVPLYRTSQLLQCVLQTLCTCGWANTACRDAMALGVRVYRCTDTSQSTSILFRLIKISFEKPVLKCSCFLKLQKTKCSL